MPGPRVGSFAVDGVKRCCHCAIDLPVSEFGACRRMKDGLWIQCRKCARSIKREWLSTGGGREKAKARRVAVMASMCVEQKDAIRARDRERYRRNPDPIKARANRAYAKDPASAIAKVKAYRLREPEKTKAWLANGKARRRGRVGGEERITPAQYRALLKRDVCCYLCGKRNDRKTNSIDHVTPLSKGGLHVFENLRITHLQCNMHKHDRIVLLPFTGETLTW